MAKSKDLLKYGRNTTRNLIFEITTYGDNLGRTPGPLGELFGEFYKVYTKNFLMRGQTLFWGHYKMVIELLKRDHFLTNCIFWLISSISDNGKILNFLTFDLEPLQM